MTIAERDTSSFLLSTRPLAPAKRLPALRDVFGQLVRLDIDAQPGVPVEVLVHAAPGVRRVKMMSALTARLARPAPMLADGDDAVCLMIKTGGQIALTQRGREASPQTGDGLLLLYREPAAMRFVDTTYVAVRVPFGKLAGFADVGAAAARCIPRDTEALALLRAYLASMPARITDPQLCQLSATHIYDLMALAIGATDEGRQVASQRSVRAARLAAMEADLMRNPAISLDQLAMRQGISSRYVQMLFEEAGTTFSDFVLDRRLDAARSMLESPRHALASITAIALEAGFSDLSYFNRRFKRRYGMTPSELRSQAKRIPASQSGHR